MATIICELDLKKAARIALSTVRLRLEFNYSSVDHVIFCTYESVHCLLSCVKVPISCQSHEGENDHNSVKNCRTLNLVIN